MHNVEGSTQDETNFMKFVNFLDFDFCKIFVFYDFECSKQTLGKLKCRDFWVFLLIRSIW